MEKRPEADSAQELVIDVNGHPVFTARWVMAQIRALSDLHDYNKNRITICYVLTGLSALVSLAALVIAIAR